MSWPRAPASCRSRRTDRTSPPVPTWHVAGNGKNAYFRLSGTSMATPTVSGGVALLLDAEDSLTPGQVKIALQAGASFVAKGGLVGAGAGSVHFPTSIKLAQQGLVPSLLSTVDGLVGTSGGATYRDSGTMINRLYGKTGLRLLGVLDSGVLWQQAESAEWGVLNLLGLLNPLGRVPAHRLIWGEVADWAPSNHLGGATRSRLRPGSTWSGVTPSTRAPISCGATR